VGCNRDGVDHAIDGRATVTYRGVAAGLAHSTNDLTLQVREFHEFFGQFGRGAMSERLEPEHCCKDVLQWTVVQIASKRCKTFHAVGTDVDDAHTNRK